MYKFVTWTVMCSLSLWLAVGAVQACPPDDEGEQQTMVISMIGANGEPVVVSGGGGAPPCLTNVVMRAIPAGAMAIAGGDARFITLTSADGKTVTPGGPVFTRAIAMAGEDPEELKNRGWLGVQIGMVAESLSDQLRLDGKGAMVLNVVEGSPAEKAGIAQHDVIVAINGHDIDGGVEKFVEAVRGQKPSDKVDLKVLRNGKEMNFTGVELAARDTADFKWKFDFSPMAEVEEHVNTRGRIVLKDDKGNWVVQDLGDLKDLPDHISQMLPRAEHRATVIIDSADGGGKTVKIKVSRDGESTEIAREDGADIHVTRTDKSGTTTENTYANEDELKAADEGAFDLLQGHNGQVSINFGGGGAIGLSNIDLDLDGLHDGLAEVRIDVRQNMEEAHKAYKEAMEQLKNLKIELPDLAKDGAMFEKQVAPFVHARMIGKPKHTFEVQPDGRIDVRIRKGDSELVQKFAGEQDLQNRDAELYAKYQDLMSADRE